MVGISLSVYCPSHSLYSVNTANVKLFSWQSHHHFYKTKNSLKNSYFIGIVVVIIIIVIIIIIIIYCLSKEIAHKLRIKVHRKTCNTLYVYRPTYLRTYKTLH